MKYKLHQEQITTTTRFHIFRVAVPGGWLYKYGGSSDSGCVFVPDPTVEIEQ